MHIMIIGEVSGYKIKEPWTWKRFLDLVKCLGIFLIIIAIIWFFPPTHKLIMDLYENNRIIKVVINSIGQIIIGIIKGIGQFFKIIF